MVETFDGDILAGSGNGLIRSTDQGQNWELVAFSDSSIIAIAVSQENTIIVATGRGGHIFQSHDHGLNWKLVSTGLPPLPQWGWLLIINSGNRLFAANRLHGIYQSLDLGNSWQSCNDGLTDIEVSAMGLDPEGYLYAGTVNGRIFRTSMTTLLTPGS
jgi:photosystem II stability/assembly factor-like uncharacterized protein